MRPQHPRLVPRKYNLTANLALRSKHFPAFRTSWKNPRPTRLSGDSSRPSHKQGMGGTLKRALDLPDGECSAIQNIAYCHFVGWQKPVKNEASEMQVLCKSTGGRAETQCPVCNQGFVMFWERQSRMERDEALREIQKVLLSHHRRTPGPQAHPTGGFLVPEWNGPVAFSGAAIPGDAPSWAL
jgi:hypothetical protein